MSFSFDNLSSALQLLAGRLAMNRSGCYSLVVCGGAALNAMKLVERVTKDVDIIALLTTKSQLESPAPLPEELLIAAHEVARTMRLPDDWLNNGPSSGPGGLYQMGLPDGFRDRLTRCEYGENLTVYFIGRLDQIYFKLYAAIDQYGSYHASDLRQLDPTDEEMLMAVKWITTHNPSEGFRFAARLFLKEFGYERLADTL